MFRLLPHQINWMSPQAELSLSLIKLLIKSIQKIKKLFAPNILYISNDIIPNDPHTFYIHPLFVN